MIFWSCWILLSYSFRNRQKAAKVWSVCLFVFLQLQQKKSTFFSLKVLSDICNLMEKTLMSSTIFRPRQTLTIMNLVIRPNMTRQKSYKQNAHAWAWTYWLYSRVKHAHMQTNTHKTVQFVPLVLKTVYLKYDMTKSWPAVVGHREPVRAGLSNTKARGLLQSGGIPRSHMNEYTNHCTRIQTGAPNLFLWKHSVFYVLVYCAVCKGFFSFSNKTV